MKYNTATPYIAAFIIFRKQGEIALLLRQNTGWMDEYYGLPAGKVENNESFIEAAIREAKEETGIDLKKDDLKHVLTLHRNRDGDDTVWVDVLFEATAWEGELVNAEPDKHSELSWFSPEHMPKNTIPVTIYYLENIAKGNTYAEYGWPE